MGARKSKQPAAIAKPRRGENESSRSSSDDSESEDTELDKRVSKKPRKASTVAEVSSKDSTSESSRSEDEDSSCDSESEDTAPSKTVAKPLPKGSTSKRSQIKNDSEDSSSDSNSDNAEPRKTVAKVPAKGSTLKRSRCDDGGGSTENARPTKCVTKEAARNIFHKSYNGSNGCCTLLAGKIYFKIPQVLLTRPSKYFREKLARVKRKRGGRGASRPTNIMFEMQERPEDVGALHWLLTAYPNEILEQGDSSKADLPRLISVLYMTNKYQFPEHEQWAKSQLQQYFASSHSNGLTLSSARYKRLYTMAPHIWQQFKYSITMKWLSHLDDHTLCSTEMLDFAESMNDRFLQAHVYYNQLIRLKGGRQDNSLAPLFHENNFTPRQTICLYRGFWSLSQFWAGIRTPELKECAAKDHRDNCTKHWTWMWEQGAGTTGGDSFGSATLQEQAAIFDPLGALDCLVKLPPSPSTSGDTERCGCRFQALVVTLRNRLRDELADHFLGPVIGNASQ